MKKEIFIGSQATKAEAIEFIESMEINGAVKVIITDNKERKTRTIPQNSCLHSYCQQLADALNSAGYDFNDGKVIRLPVQFTPETVKEYMFKRVMRALYPDKVSTTELSTVEIQSVYENLNNFTSSKFGVGLQWPDRHNGGQG